MSYGRESGLNGMRWLSCDCRIHNQGSNAQTRAIFRSARGLEIKLVRVDIKIISYGIKSSIFLNRNTPESVLSYVIVCKYGVILNFTTTPQNRFEEPLTFIG